MDPHQKRNRKLKASRNEDDPRARPQPLLSKLNLECYRLALDHVIERRVNITSTVLWVPVLPNVSMPLVTEPITWRRWAFEHAHNSYLNPHRSATETYHILRRMGYWDTLIADCDRWCAECETCLSHRGQTLHPPLRNILADSGLAEVLPWCDVIVDMKDEVCHT